MIHTFVLLTPSFRLGKFATLFPFDSHHALARSFGKTLRSAQRLGYIPVLRVNYRKYGLDEQTTRAIQELGQ